MLRVLVTDDAAFMRKILGDILKRNNCEVVGEASNGEEAIEKYKLLKPDFVTMDITMPIMNGLQAIRFIQQIDDNCKILMVTAMGQESMIYEAMEAGAKGFIVKPFQESKIAEEINKISEITV